MCRVRILELSSKTWKLSTSINGLRAKSAAQQKVNLAVLEGTAAYIEKKIRGIIRKDYLVFYLLFFMTRYVMIRHD
jgi:hypothetical protein